MRHAAHRNHNHGRALTGRQSVQGSLRAQLATAHRTEQLVGIYSLLNRHGALLDLEAALAGQLDDALARDSGQDGAAAQALVSTP